MNEGGDAHLRFALGTLPPSLNLRWTSERVHLADSLYAGGPSTLAGLDEAACSIRCFSGENRGGTSGRTIYEKHSQACPSPLVSEWRR